MSNFAHNFKKVECQETFPQTIIMRKPIIFFLFILCFASAVHAQIAVSPDLNCAYPKREVRAVWLTTIGGIDWPHSYSQSTLSAEKQKQELRDILDKLQLAGINTVLLQTRIRGTVIYPSRYEPWDGCLSGFPGRSPGYDALAFAIDECHKRGMELHCWIVTMPVGKWNTLGCKSLCRRYPSLIRKIDADGYMNPEDSRTAPYLAGICEEITRNYDIDGIHLDYIRYPETWNIKVSRSRGREYITQIVEEIHQRVKQLKPWVKLSCSPIGKFDDLSRYQSHGWNAYTKVCQDVQGWLRDGLMDEIFPMMYFQDNQFFPFAIDWAEQSHGRIVAPGLGIYFMSPSEANWPLSTISREMQVLRQYHMGHTYFRSKFFTDDTKGIYQYARHQFDRYPALVPAMTWECGQKPIAPATLHVDFAHSELKWSGAIDNRPAHQLFYNVYASDTYPVDINDARNLIATRLAKTSLKLNLDETMYYAVTAMDRYGNESDAKQSIEEPIRETPANFLLKCNGRQLQLPRKDNTLDADYVTIETLQGQIIGSRRYLGATTDVCNIPEGFYVLRSINKKGIAHRLGFFIVRR